MPKWRRKKMTIKDKADEKIRELHLGRLDELLDDEIKRHYHSSTLSDDKGPTLHSKEYFDEIVGWYTTDVSEDERIPNETLKSLLKSKVRRFLRNDCVECGRLVKYFSEKYKLD